MQGSNWFHTHAHSNFSVQDGMSKVQYMVERAARYGQPALALTDHGVMSGTVQLYQHAKKNGIMPFPGIEAYILDPNIDAAGLAEASGAQRYHLGILARNFKGYTGLVKLSTLSHTRPRYSRFPRLLLDDLYAFGAEYGDDIIITTGCVFGLVEKTLIDEGPDAARGVIRALRQITPNLYVEIQKHNITDNDDVNPLGEDELVRQMVALADEFGLPIIASQDCHYLDQADKTAHALMKRMLYGGKEDEFPGDTFHMCSTDWIAEKYSPAIWDRVESASRNILEMYQLSIPELDNYKAYVPKVSTNPEKVLRETCEIYLDEMEGIDRKIYQDRLEYELDVIQAVDMANYFLLVKQCVDYVRLRKVPIEARGSGNGSLVLFCLGVTQVDPIIWGTDFDRFMARDRLTAPDVDIDIADNGRWIILEYLESLKINGIKYKTSHIGTFSSLGQAENDNNDTGSAFNTYISSLKKRYLADAWAEEKDLAEKDGRKPVKKTADANGSIRWNMSADSKIKTLEDVKKVHPGNYDGLKRIINMRSAYRGRGKHAGGILISAEELDINEFVPTMLVGADKESNTKEDSIVSQYTMKDVEQFGLTKMDWLGQTSLTVMTKCNEFLGLDDVTDFSWIPNDDPDVLKFVSDRNNHVGLFHLENYPKSIAMQELKPTSTADFMIHQAYSMPGAADSGAKNIYLSNRKAKKAVEYEYDHPDLHRIFDPTLGVMLFQEQVLDVCRAVGMVGTELTEFFSIVKDSGAGAVERNRVRLEHGRIRFVELAEETGLTSAEIDWVWQQMVAMGGYAFNRAHAAGYGIRSYRTAYLKYHHPTEYMAALLYCWAGHSKKIRARGGEIKLEEHYMRAAKKMGIRILPVSVTKSKARPVVEGKAIRKGFINVVGIGDKVAAKIENGMPYTDLRDFAERARVNGSVPYLKSGTMGSLLEKLELTDVFDWE